jgi:hypothetical protein
LTVRRTVHTTRHMHTPAKHLFEWNLAGTSSCEVTYGVNVHSARFVSMSSSSSR